ncbi:MAG: hypothetical protein JWQ40_3284, partial [Segetibacter sp.]|nr:hypothetical protein [Segetibacter sp.]
SITAARNKNIAHNTGNLLLNDDVLPLPTRLIILLSQLFNVTYSNTYAKIML